MLLEVVVHGLVNVDAVGAGAVVLLSDVDGALLTDPVANAGFVLNVVVNAPIVVALVAVE